jgi:hypothetical protein
MRRLVKNKGGFLPKEFNIPHDLCFCVHDILAQFLVSGERCGVFTPSIVFDDAESADKFEACEDIFEWLEYTGRLEDRARVLKTLVLPAVLSDMLHCIYEALEASRKGKLNISYMLIRKPIQENLFLLESMVLDEVAFAEKLATSPITLRHQTASGVEGEHKRRIQRVLEAMGQTEAFDAEYLAQLRYLKTQDGFDGACNKAMHLFTEHKAIRTESLNVNFIFSDLDAKHTQWGYLYGRLPYVLIYTWRIIEYVGEMVCPTHPEYMQDMTRRVAAYATLSASSVVNLTAPLERFFDYQYTWLRNHCEALGTRPLRRRDLERMALTGALPDEEDSAVAARLERFSLIELVNRTNSEL